jgi:hypothetical protein
MRGLVNEGGESVKSLAVYNNKIVSSFMLTALKQASDHGVYKG